MKRLAPLSVLAAAALASLAGCMTYERAPAPQASIATQTIAYRPGIGVIERMGPAPMAAAGASATAAPADQASRMNRLLIRMNDGTMQYIDTDSQEFKTGDRVELTPDHYIRMAP